MLTERKKASFDFVHQLGDNTLDIEKFSFRKRKHNYYKLQRTKKTKNDRVLGVLLDIGQDFYLRGVNIY